MRTRPLHRKLTGSKTAGQIEREVKERGKEQVMNSVKKRELQDEMNDMLEPENIQGISYEFDCLEPGQTKEDKKNAVRNANTDNQTLV